MPCAARLQGTTRELPGSDSARSRTLLAMRRPSQRLPRGCKAWSLQHSAETRICSAPLISGQTGHNRTWPVSTSCSAPLDRRPPAPTHRRSHDLRPAHPAWTASRCRPSFKTQPGAYRTEPGPHGPATLALVGDQQDSRRLMGQNRAWPHRRAERLTDSLHPGRERAYADEGGVNRLLQVLRLRA